MWNLPNAKEKIIETINHVRVSKRKRPSMQEIFQTINEPPSDNDGHFETMDISLFKEAIASLEEHDKIINRGTEGKDSYFIVEEKKTDPNIFTLEEVSGESEKFITDKLLKVIDSRIKLEVKVELIRLQKESNSLLYNEGMLLKPPNLNEVHQNELIENLKSEIEFLRKELLSKSEIIKMLIDDNSIKSNANDSIATASKKLDIASNKNLLNQKKIKPSVVTRNTFDALSEENTSDVVHSNDESFQSVTHKKHITKRNITILGDSIIKDMKSFKMKQGLTSKEKVFIKSFPGATNECMVDYIKPTLKHNPDVIIVHSGTNDLRSTEKSAGDIANEIIKLAKSIKSDNNEIIVSGLVGRNDPLNDKGNDVNNLLKVMCTENTLLYCDNTNVSRKHHLNTSGLHLNAKGTTTLANNYLRCLNY